MTTQQPTAVTGTKALGGRLRVIFGHRAVWPLAALVVILIVDGIISPDFFSIRIPIAIPNPIIHVKHFLHFIRIIENSLEPFDSLHEINIRLNRA